MKIIPVFLPLFFEICKSRSILYVCMDNTAAILLYIPGSRICMRGPSKRKLKNKSMENEKKYYSVSDLAALLEVPRTTVNDWLKKYDRYIDFEMRGRRKVYTDASLEVLRKVSSARDQGTAAADLERFLASSCAVRPELTDGTADTAQIEKNTEAEQLPAVKFDMPAFFAEFEKRAHFQERARRRGFLWVSLLLVLLLAAACMTLFLLGQLLTLRESGKNLELRLAASREETALLRKRSEEEFKAIAGQVESTKRSNAAESAVLKQRLADQKKQFERLFLQLEKTEKIRSGELRKLRDENSKLKTQLRNAELQAVENMRKSEKESFRQISSLKQEIHALQQENADLKHRLGARDREIVVLKEQNKKQTLPAEKVEKKNEQ